MSEHSMWTQRRFIELHPSERDALRHVKAFIEDIERVLTAAIAYPVKFETVFYGEPGMVMDARLRVEIWFQGKEESHRYSMELSISLREQSRAYQASLYHQFMRQYAAAVFQRTFETA